MNIKIEFRYAMLNSIFILLWLSLEYVAGFHDRLMAWYPYVTFLSIIIPIACYRLAFKEKIEKTGGNFTFRHAFISGLILTLFSSILVVPIQLLFNRFVNPDFLYDMIKYTIQIGKQNAEAAIVYYSFSNYLIETVLFTFFEGIIISLILARIMRTVK